MRTFTNRSKPSSSALQALRALASPPLVVIVVQTKPPLSTWSYDVATTEPRVRQLTALSAPSRVTRVTRSFAAGERNGVFLAQRSRFVQAQLVFAFRRREGEAVN